MTAITTHDEAECVVRSALLGVHDLRFFDYGPQGRRAPIMNVRAYSATIGTLGSQTAVVTGNWRLPTTAEQIRDDAQKAVDSAIAQRRAGAEALESV